ncbi:MAG: AAA family ATPase [Chitinispirillaceae bacterium]|nr:AAA family ATPase [Chitinispirillaceae bacterium]
MNRHTGTTASDDLFRKRGEELLQRSAPLADRMRPRTLDEYIGQRHIIGEGRLLRRAIQVDQLSSLIFYGPPGTGKTTLARIIANTTSAKFISINAVLAGVKDIRDAIEQAHQSLSLYGKRTILFIDEVHRFNKSQQDALLPHVENGVLTLIGATTENPYFEVNKALVSRSRIFQLQQLTGDDLKEVARQALTDKERGYGSRTVHIDDDALEHLVRVASGDARGVLNALELAVETTTTGDDGTVHIDRATIEDSIQKRAVLYDKDGDAHYDTISAFIKSLRGSDPDAALYWMAKMLYAGEDPRFIFRRMLILAGEDVGMADPRAIGVVVDAARAFDYVGLPEGRYHLAHACLYLATAPKSNSSMGFFDATATVSSERQDDVPNHLRDASRDKEGFGHGAGYLYPHAYRDHWVAQQYLPRSLQGKLFYQPSDQGFEKAIADQVARLREARLEAMVESDDHSPLSDGPGSDGETPVHQQWLERSLGSRGVQLGSIRATLLEKTALRPSALVLDLCTRTGLLALEAARIVREGGVWALSHSGESLTTASQMASRIDPLSRPVVLQTDWDRFEQDLFAAAGVGVLFDAIIGRSVLTKITDKKKLIGRIAGLLAPGGRIVLAETVPSAGQRLSALVDFSEIDPQARALFVECENDLFADRDDPMVNWTAKSLGDDLSAVTDGSCMVTTQALRERRRIKPGDIDFWFRVTDGTTERLSLGERCARRLDEATVRIIRELFHRKLDHQEVEWHSEVAYVVMTAAAGAA